MTTIAFDTSRFSKRPKDGGVPELQAEAEALAEVLEVNLKELATKADISELRKEHGCHGKTLGRQADDARATHDHQARNPHGTDHRHRSYAGQAVVSHVNTRNP